MQNASPSHRISALPLAIGALNAQPEFADTLRGSSLRQRAAASSDRPRVDVVGVQIDAIDMTSAVDTISAWADAGASRVVCACNVHAAVTARSDPSLCSALASADLVVADGAPIAWVMRRRGCASQRRVAGPDLMWAYFAVAAERRQAVFLYGGSEATLAALQRVIELRFPQLPVAGAYSPPYRPLTVDEDEAIVARINASGAKTVWVALGCPRQEAWMAAHSPSIRAVMVGVGAAFNFHAGTVRRAPLWAQRIGLEWLHRLASEPKRLWRRYLVTNSSFVALATIGLLRR